MTEETLFREALSKPSDERAKFLDETCSGDVKLRAAVEALLAAQEPKSDLLDLDDATGAFAPIADVPELLSNFVDGEGQAAWF